MRLRIGVVQVAVGLDVGAYYSSRKLRHQRELLVSSAMFKNLNADQSIHQELGSKGSMGDSAPSISPTSIRSPVAKTAQPMQVCCSSRDPSRWSASSCRSLFDTTGTRYP
jgi:hypothetical protein